MALTVTTIIRVSVQPWLMEALSLAARERHVGDESAIVTDYRMHPYNRIPPMRLKA
jgi:hypothetical protein